ncbi:hypothetical protein ACQKM2_13730 [Streptomyces sp. NPDC004126]|uniref:helicase associated domain-containing protein n=1 Tax=Streptomyces sp. NPDC004126 TaxID=3390695 RepID=UPI003D084864
MTAYVLGTGIDYGHPDLGGRVVRGFDAVGDGRSGGDCNGQGTHAAGILGGTTYGVARKVNLVGEDVGRWVATQRRNRALLNAEQQARLRALGITPARVVRARTAAAKTGTAGRPGAAQKPSGPASEP